MSLLTYVIWFVAFLTAFVVGINFLPSASDYPVPLEIGQAITTLWGYLNSFNQILPIDTLFDILYLSILYQIIIRILWPSIFWVWGMLVRSNP